MDRASSSDDGVGRGRTHAWAIVLIAVLLGTNVGTLFAFFQARDEDTAQAPSEAIPVQSLVRPAFRVINGHEHLYKEPHLKNYLAAATTTEVDQTVFVASSSATFLGKDGKQNELYDWNTEEILRASQNNPGRIIPFCTIHPDDPEKLEKLKKYVAQGAKGLKLYTGHSDFHDRPLTTPEMLPIYAYCESINLPICWHIRLGRFGNEFEDVMKAYPNLTVIIPHFGVTFFRPDTEFQTLPKLLASYPNVYVDTSFGTRAILVQGLETVSKHTRVFREFFLGYSDRIVFGTDMVVTGNSEKTTEWVEAVIRACRDVLEKDQYHFYMAAKGSPYALPDAENLDGVLRGLNLPNEVLTKVYTTNLEGVLSRIRS